MEKYQNKYRIPSARAVWHHYTGGEYFITICTSHRHHYFGEIHNGVMIYTTVGQYAVENLEQIKTHYSYCEIPLFVVMPNHIHAIVVIDDCRRDDARIVSTTQNRGLLSTAIGGLKSAITKFANLNKIEFGWHTRFHDHIIRNQEEMNRIATYIENNPVTWKGDKFYSV